MCTYNGSQYLEQQIESVLSQTYPICEFVVVDDCSTDDTYEILCKYQQQNPNLFRVYRNGNTKGVNLNFQYALNLAKCNYIAPCDQDDIWYPEKIAMCVSLFEKNPNIVMTFCQDRIIGEKDDIIEDSHRTAPNIDDMVFCRGGVWGHTMLLKRDVLADWLCVDNMLWDTSLTLHTTCYGEIAGTDFVGCVWRRHASAFSFHSVDELALHKPIRGGGGNY